MSGHLDLKARLFPVAPDARSSAKGTLPKPSMACKALPWVAGAGMALGHAAVASNCTIPQQGRCSSCGSCAVVVGSLVLWALTKQRSGRPFYEG